MYGALYGTRQSEVSLIARGDRILDRSHSEKWTMKKVEISAYGAPEEVAHCIDAPELGAPGPGEVILDVLAFPINPADLSFCRGNYRLHPALPATPGAECVGRVTAVGAGVTTLKPGEI